MWYRCGYGVDVSVIGAMLNARGWLLGAFAVQVWYCGANQPEELPNAPSQTVHA